MVRSKPLAESAPNFLSFLSAAQSDEEDDGQLTPLCHPDAHAQSTGSFFSRVKQTFSSSPLGSMLGQNSSTAARSFSDARMINNTLKNLDALEDDDSPALTPHRNSTVKRVFTPMPDHRMTHSRSSTSGSCLSNAMSDSNSLLTLGSTFPSSCLSPLSLSSQLTGATSAHESDVDSKWSPVLASPSETQTTPPLTPATSGDDTTFLQDTHNTHSLASSQRSAPIFIKDDDDTSKSPQSRKGKDPAPPFPYDTLMEDISGGIPVTTDDVDENDEEGEWWGLDYTLQLSRRDSRASDTSSNTTGEHSKSRESWAAMHYGTVPLLSADANFEDWQRWHRTLDKIELRRRRKRTIDFIEESERRANLYLDEVLAQRAIQIHEELLSDEELYDALVWVEYAAERRPDPFFPPEKHNLGWVLKSHRSVACLRELEEYDPFDEETD